MPEREAKRVGQPDSAGSRRRDAAIRPGANPARAAAIRRLAIASICGQLIWLAMAVLGGILEPGYSMVRDAVSMLGAQNAARPWLFDTAVAIWGLSFIGGAVALALDAPRGVRGWLGPTLIAITGAAQILDGFPFPLDCRPSIDPGCHARELAGHVSWQHVAHGWTYFIGGIAVELSVFAMAWRFRGDRRWGRADLLSLAAGVVGIAIGGMLFFGTPDEAHGHYGLVQRVALAAGGIWVAALMVGLLAIYGSRSALVPRLVRWARGGPGGDLLVHPGSGLAPAEAGLPCEGAGAG